VAGEPGTAELLELFGDWQRLSRRLTSRNGAHAVGTATHPNEEEP